MENKIKAFFTMFVICILGLSIRLYDISTNNPAKEALSGQYTRTFTAASKQGAVYDTNLLPISFSDNEYITIINPAKLNYSITHAAEILADRSLNKKREEIKKSLENKTIFTLVTTKPVFELWAKSFVLYKQDNSQFARHIIGYCKENDSQGIYRYYKDILETMSGKLEVSYSSDATDAVMGKSDATVFDKGYLQTDGIIMSIDENVQTICEKVADNFMGAGVILVSDSKNGDILACVSRPVYDIENISDYLNSEDGEFLNRAFCAYPLGSVFKIITAAAALENNPEIYNLEYECTGCIVAGNNTIKCHKADGHGKITMKEAFANSCNPYFINLANIIGYDMILEMATRLGIGSSDNIDRFEIQKGALPNDPYPSPALVANTAIGQGQILVTPIEALNIINAASTGKIHTFSLVKGYKKDNNIYYNSEKPHKEVLDKTIVSLLCDMLKHCVNYGTGNKAYVYGANAGGKTGTAQTGRYDKNGREINHHWFAGAFPIDNPKYTIVVLYDEKTSKNNDGVPQQAFAEICKKLKNNIQN